MRIGRTACLVLISSRFCWGAQDGLEQPDSQWEELATVPSKYIEAAKGARAAGRFYLRFTLDRSFARTAMEPVRFEKETIKETGLEWSRWFMDLRWILRDVGILHEPFGRSGSRTIERSREFDLKEYEYRERAERYGKDGDTFVIATVLTAVSHSADFEDINLVYYAIRRLMVRQLAAQDGPFDDVPVEVGDACYHLGTDAFGFIRGNVIVEIGVTPGWREDGKLRVRSPDTEWRKKMVEAARRIDAMLMEKMFSKEVRTRIRAAKKKSLSNRICG